MTMIVGFEYHNIEVRRSRRVQSNIKVKHNLSFEEVKLVHLPRFDKKPAIELQFTFTVDYTPDVAKIVIGGNIIYTHTKDIVERAIKTWEKDKKLIPDVSLEVLNSILTKCNVKALELAEELNLPAHIPLPQLNVAQQKYGEYIG